MAGKHHDEDAKHKSHGAPHGAHGGGHEEHEGAPEWLISFADNVTLMMGFFVIMLAFNMGPKGGGSGQEAAAGETPGQPAPDTLDLAIAIRDAFNNPVDLNSMDPNEQQLVRRLLERRGKAQTEDDGPLGDQHRVQSIRPSDYYGVCGTITFAADSTHVDETAHTTLLEVAKHVRGLRFVVNVRGHASAAEAYLEPVHGVQLSHERAMAVGRILAENGVDWRQLRLQACGAAERIATRVYDIDGHRANQRVEIVVTNDTPEE